MSLLVYKLQFFCLCFEMKLKVVLVLVIFIGSIVASEFVVEKIFFELKIQCVF